MQPDGTDPIYSISATIGDFAQSRHDADKSSAAVYSVNGAPTADHPNYGIAITGIVDIHSDCLPTRIDTNKNYESPEVSSRHPRPPIEPDGTWSAFGSVDWTGAGG